MKNKTKKIKYLKYTKTLKKQGMLLKSQQNQNLVYSMTITIQGKYMFLDMLKNYQIMLLLKTNLNTNYLMRFGRLKFETNIFP